MDEVVKVRFAKSRAAFRTCSERLLSAHHAMSAYQMQAQNAAIFDPSDAGQLPPNPALGSEHDSLDRAAGSAGGKDRSLAVEIAVSLSLDWSRILSDTSMT
ncbi:MAG: hypothetical protein WAT77_12520 [Paracoccaceae bacterium]